MASKIISDSFYVVAKTMVFGIKFRVTLTDNLHFFNPHLFQTYVCGPEITAPAAAQRV